MDLDRPGDTDGFDEIFLAAKPGLSEIVIGYSDRPAELAESLRRLRYTVTLESRGPDDRSPPSLVRISWAFEH